MGPRGKPTSQNGLMVGVIYPSSAWVETWEQLESSGKLYDIHPPHPKRYATTYPNLWLNEPPDFGKLCEPVSYGQ